MKYQTFWRRVGAAFLDGLIFMPVGIIGLFLIHIFHSPIISVIWEIIHMWTWVAYSVLMHGHKGQTVGKIICKVRVLDISESKLSLKQAFLRDIVPIVVNVVHMAFIIFNPTYYYGFKTKDLSYLSGMPKWYWIGMIIFSSITFLWFLLEVLTMLLNNKRRAVHDFIAGSVVCRDV
ncbi:hypothetical protein BVX98_05535 [bacterium F11]|nr:hypothetical protein BVX98_05535 [bacterium F11]